MQLRNRPFSTHTIKKKSCKRAFWACSTAQQGNSKAAADEDEKALSGLVQLRNKQFSMLTIKKVEKAFLGLCNCATDIVNHGRLILILCLVIQGMNVGGG